MKKYAVHGAIGLLIAVVCGFAAGCGTGGGGSTGTFNTAPVANAGSYKSVVTDTVVTLNGSASSDLNGDHLTYSWAITSKPTGSSAALLSATVAKPTFTPDLAGTYALSLVVNDGRANSAVATATIEAVKYVSMVTGMGTIKIELYGQKSPLTTQNFLDYVTSDFYSDTLFHRVWSGFMIQGGGFTSALVQKPTNAPIKNEAANGLKNLRGTLAMARTGVVDSATAQFFINVVDNATLDYTAATTAGYGYAVFGAVVEGMDVVDSIAAVPTATYNDMDHVPTTPVVINSVSTLP